VPPTVGKPSTKKSALSAGNHRHHPGWRGGTHAPTMPNVVPRFCGVTFTQFAGIRNVVVTGGVALVAVAPVSVGVVGGFIMAVDISALRS
jgi:hypothetical protein